MRTQFLRVLSFYWKHFSKDDTAALLKTKTCKDWNKEKLHLYYDFDMIINLEKLCQLTEQNSKISRKKNLFCKKIFAKSMNKLSIFAWSAPL